MYSQVDLTILAFLGSKEDWNDCNSTSDERISEVTEILVQVDSEKLLLIL